MSTTKEIIQQDESIEMGGGRDTPTGTPPTPPKKKYDNPTPKVSDLLTENEKILHENIYLFKSMTSIHYYLSNIQESVDKLIAKLDDEITTNKKQLAAYEKQLELQEDQIRGYKNLILFNELVSTFYADLRKQLHPLNGDEVYDMSYLTLLANCPELQDNSSFNLLLKVESCSSQINRKRLHYAHRADESSLANITEKQMKRIVQRATDFWFKEDADFEEVGMKMIELIKTWKNGMFQLNDPYKK